MSRRRSTHFFVAAATAFAGALLGLGGQVGANITVDEDANTVVAGDEGIARFDLAHNPERDEYLAVWEDFSAPFVVPGSSAVAIIGQRLSGDADPIGAAFVIATSPDGQPGTLLSGAAPPSVAYNAATNQYLVAYGRELPARPATVPTRVVGRLVSDRGVPVGGEATLSKAHVNTDSASCRAQAPEVVADPGTGGYVVAYGLRPGAPPCEGLAFGEWTTFVQALDGALGRGPGVRLATQNGSGAPTTKIAHNPVSGQFMVTQRILFRGASNAGTEPRRFEAQLFNSALTAVRPLLTINVDPTDATTDQPIVRSIPVADPVTGNWFIASTGGERGKVWTNLLGSSGNSLRPGQQLIAPNVGGLNNVSALGRDQFVLSTFNGFISQLDADGTVIAVDGLPLFGNSANQPVALATTNGTGVAIGRANGGVATAAFRISAAAGVLPLAPARLLDTRSGPAFTTTDGIAQGIGRVQGGRFVELAVTGRGGVPAGAAAVNLNITADAAAGPGFVTAYPCDARRPNASNLNHVPQGAVAAAAFARLSATGTVCLFTSSSADLIVDVNGYVPQGGSVEPLVPARLLDTREGFDTVDNVSAGTGRVAAGSTTTIRVTGRGGVDADAEAVIVGATTVGPDTAGFLTVYPCDEDRPNASSVNASGGATVNNLVLAKLSARGTICVFSSAATDLIIDVAGYVPESGGLVALVPARLLETRPGFTTIDGNGQTGTRANANSVTTLRVAGRGGVDDDATGAVLNVVAASPDTGGFLTVYPCDEDRPNASNVNLVAGADVSNAVVVKLSASGTVCVFSFARTDLVVDVVGYSLGS